MPAKVTAVQAKFAVGSHPLKLLPNGNDEQIAVMALAKKPSERQIRRCIAAAIQEHGATLHELQIKHPADLKAGKYRTQPAALGIMKNGKREFHSWKVQVKLVELGETSNSDRFTSKVPGRSGATIVAKLYNAYTIQHTNIIDDYKKSNITKRNRLLITHTSQGEEIDYQMPPDRERFQLVGYETHDVPEGLREQKCANALCTRVLGDKAYQVGKWFCGSTCCAEYDGSHDRARKLKNKCAGLEALLKMMKTTLTEVTAAAAKAAEVTLQIPAGWIPEADCNHVFMSQRLNMHIKLMREAGMKDDLVVTKGGLVEETQLVQFVDSFLDPRARFTMEQASARGVMNVQAACEAMESAHGQELTATVLECYSKAKKGDPVMGSPL